MNRSDLEDLEKAVMKEVVNRRHLGGFDANAGTILLLTEWMMLVVRHLSEKETKIKK